MFKHKRHYSAYQKNGYTKTIKKTLIAMGIMLLLFIIGGVGYVYYSGRQDTPAQSTASKDAEPQESSPLPDPPKPDPNAPIGISIQYLESPVVAGANSSLNIHVNPGANCKIAVVYNNVPSKDSGLSDKTADIHGNITWTWTVESGTPAGKWPVTVNCANSKKTGMVQGDLVVTK